MYSQGVNSSFMMIKTQATTWITTCQRGKNS